MCGALAAAATTVSAASRPTRSTEPSPICRPAGSLLSLPTPHRWSPAMATSGFASPSTLLPTAWSPEQPGCYGGVIPTAWGAETDLDRAECLVGGELDRGYRARLPGRQVVVGAHRASSRSSVLAMSPA